MILHKFAVSKVGSKLQLVKKIRPVRQKLKAITKRQNMIVAFGRSSKPNILSETILLARKLSGIANKLTPLFRVRQR